MFVAMNRFRVNEGRDAEFEEAWRGREASMEEVDGFLQFMLLRGDQPGEYVSHSTWVSREAFVGWAQSDHFRRVHSAGMPEGIIAGHPRASFYDSVLVERAVSRA